LRRIWTICRQPFFAQADFDNYRKRLKGTFRKMQRNHVSGWCEALIPIVDGFRARPGLAPRASPKLPERDLELSYKQLMDIWAKAWALNENDPAGQPVDPHQHQSVDRRVNGQAPTARCSGIPPGYVFGGRVLAARHGACPVHRHRTHRSFSAN